MHQPVYHSRDIQVWEQRWFSQQNSKYGLMQQAAWSIAQRIIEIFTKKSSIIKTIAVCCGAGNNAGDGYLVAKYLDQSGFDVDVYATQRAQSESLNLAYQEALEMGLNICPNFEFQKDYDVYIDALFGIGLNRELDQNWQTIIHRINAQSGLKISIDLPSGLNANTGQALPCSIKADFTLTVLGLKAGLFTGQGKEYTGEIQVVSLIPHDDQLKPIAHLSPTKIELPKRKAFGHKGSYGHVLIVGGHADMGGAVIMAAESAFSAGAGKVTVACDAKHHMAILARSPNIMLRNINALNQQDIIKLIDHVDAISFGMGLGRDDWAEQIYLKWFAQIHQSDLDVVLDADALWFLALNPSQLKANTYLTPHSGEAAKLLGISLKEIEADRIQAIHNLQVKYSGQWVLKGAGSLILENASSKNNLWICTAGNAGMATGGMGDVLAGMITSLKAQFHQDIHLHEIVTLHALAGDELAKQGMRGLQAHEMNKAVNYVVNHVINE